LVTLYVESDQEYSWMFKGAIYMK